MHENINEKHTHTLYKFKYFEIRLIKKNITEDIFQCKEGKERKDYINIKVKPKIKISKIRIWHM